MSHVFFARLALESVDLDVILLERIFAHLVFIFVGEEVHHFGAMVALKLDHLAHVLVLNDGAIASCCVTRRQPTRSMPQNCREGEGEEPTIFFLERLEKSLGVVASRQALNSRQRLATVAL